MDNVKNLAGVRSGDTLYMAFGRGYRYYHYYKSEGIVITRLTATGRAKSCYNDYEHMTIDVKCERYPCFTRAVIKRADVDEGKRTSGGIDWFSGDNVMIVSTDDVEIAKILKDNHLSFDTKF